MKRPRGQGSKSGLTLIEVVLAVTILGVGLSVLLTAASRCLAVMKVSRKYQEAQWTRGLGELEFPLVEAEDIDDMEVVGHQYPNDFTFLRDVGNDDDEDGLYIVRSKVRWSEHGRDSFEETVRYVWREDEDE